ncbi:MAG: cyclic pyranopterin monophosphate synthase MoaC [Candidatus Omnitrophica bacterium]|nr:cyclic pyranopterin monophosphate synthase MoaC [Candidatus Omnitrophota bacterium]
MADISGKSATKRIAIAQARVFMKDATLKKLIKGQIPKGDVLACAKVAGIMAAKKTSELLPLCHPLEIANVKLEFDIDETKACILVKAIVSVLGRTGVEMEALTAASIASLTIYDMCKPVDRDIVISDIMLLEKSGGKSGIYKRQG